AIAALQAIDGAARRAAARELAAIDASQGAIARSRVPLEAAIKQLTASGWPAMRPRSADIVDRTAFDEACALADRLRSRGPSARAAAMRSDLAMEELRSAPAPDAARMAELEPLVRAASDLQPFNARRMADLAEATAMRGDQPQALRLYERALALDANASLDPLAQMSDREIARIRLAQQSLRGDGAK
ncbi:MAG: hypothetical protein ACO3QC_14235, partial [Phycisphaerales bacterium]